MTRRRSDADVVGKRSPFRSYRDINRYKAALDMIEKRRAEIWEIERSLVRTSDRAEQKRLTLRLLASKNNLKSWQDYLTTTHVVRGAVIAP